MEKRKKEKQLTQIEHAHDWTLEDMERDLLARGAIEITPEEMKKEPYVTYMKNIKKNGKFICD
ncbi:MAG: hypothetical protein HYZ34_12855 [Ignavibacteriae bacterium]|nr:hypothetical protein [Ignavibacteriota bacterium]